MPIYTKVCVDCAKTFYCKGDGCGLSTSVASGLPTEIRTTGCHCPICTIEFNNDILDADSRLFLEECPKAFTVEEIIIEVL